MFQLRVSNDLINCSVIWLQLPKKPPARLFSFLNPLSAEIWALVAGKQKKEKKCRKESLYIPIPFFVWYHLTPKFVLN